MNRPHAGHLLEPIRGARARSGGLLVGLDFDGTLAPIVAEPQAAAMSGGMRAALESLVQRSDTHVAFVSGRSLDDLAGRTAIDGAWYVGNHGFEIRGPGFERVLPEAEAARETIAMIAGALERELGDVPGVIVEDKGLTLSVHYRQVEDTAAAARVRDAVVRTAAGLDHVRSTHGKMVVEIRPDIDWDKGRAFAFLRETLAPRIGAVPALFIGDDVTDEDAFRTLSPGEWAIYVGELPDDRDTAATASLHGPDEVETFLRGLDEAR